MAETITIPISEYGYAAFSASVPLNFGAVPDCEVYYLPHYSYAELRLKRVKGVAPSHFGVLIAVPKALRISALSTQKPLRISAFFYSFPLLIGIL